MLSNPKITTDHLAKKALVYVRQSTPKQVLHHQESQRLQYALVERARALGLQETLGDGRVGRGGDRLEHRGLTALTDR